MAKKAERRSAGKKGKQAGKRPARKRADFFLAERDTPPLPPLPPAPPRFTRRNVRKWALIGTAAGLATAILVLLVSVLPLLSAARLFKPCPTGLVTNQIYAVRDGNVSMFVVKAGEELICFDAGNKPANIRAGFKTLGFDPLDVKAVFLTHSDGDHVAGLRLFGNATVYLPENEEPIVKGTSKRRFLFFSGVNRIPAETYSLIPDGEEVGFGDLEVKAVATPGHTRGSTSYLLNRKVLFTGDLALIDGGKLVPMPKPPSEEPAQVIASIKKVNRIRSVNLVLTAHSGALAR